MTIGTWAVDDAGRLPNATVGVMVQPIAILDALSVSPSDFYFRLPGLGRQLAVLGLYRDGAARDLALLLLAQTLAGQHHTCPIADLRLKNQGPLALPQSQIVPADRRIRDKRSDRSGLSGQSPGRSAVQN